MTLVHRSKTWADPDTAPMPETSDLSQDSDPVQSDVALASTKKKLQREVHKLKKKDEAILFSNHLKFLSDNSTIGLQ
jgi:hypothetical protein